MKKILEFIEKDLQASGLSANVYSKERLGMSPAMFSRVRNDWNKPGIVGEETKNKLKSYYLSKRSYVGIATQNYINVHKACQKAFEMRKPIAIVGEGGYGKSFALKKYKEKAEANGKKVYYVDASLAGATSKRLIAEILRTVGAYKAGRMDTQLIEMRKALTKKDALLIIDEVSALKSYHVTVLKDIMTALRDVCGIVMAGTPFFWNNLSRGAERNRHLYNETRDRIFSIPVELIAPTDEEALRIFKANGLTEKQINIITKGRYDWRQKRTYRGIADAISMIKFVQQAQKTELSYLEEV